MVLEQSPLIVNMDLSWMKAHVRPYNGFQIHHIVGTAVSVDGMGWDESKMYALFKSRCVFKA